jgi:XTP/dITP diphosphohydrolase
MTMKQLVLASGNPGKLREFDRLLAPLGVSVVSQQSLGVASVPEPYFTFLENALVKARHACEQTGLPALADDSGICVPALDGAPGVYSARYASPESGVDQDLLNNQKLVRHLQGVDDRRAFYVAVLVLVSHAKDPLPIVAQGIWQGEVIDKPAGDHGFGYDPHFFLPQLGLTVAQLSPEQKNEISHRAIATRLLLTALRERGMTG